MADLKTRIATLRSDERILNQIRQAGLPYVNMFFIQDGEITDVCIDGSGGEAPVASGMVRLECVTKPVIAHTILQWAIEREFDLDTDLSKALGPSSDIPAGITLSLLLSHSSGLASRGGVTYTGSGIKCEERWTEDTTGLLCPPGTVYSYSDEGFAIAAHAVSVIEDEPFSNIVKKAISERFDPPLEIHADPFENRVQGVTRDRDRGIRGGVSMTMSDLLRYLRAHLESRVKPSKNGPITEYVARCMLSTGRVPLLGGTPILGYAWQHLTSGAYGHAGIGASTSIYVFMHPSLNVAGLIYVPMTSDFFLTALSSLKLLGVGGGVTETLKDPTPRFEMFAGKTFRNGKYNVSVKSEQDSFFLILENQVGEAEASLKIDQLRANLFHGNIPSGMLPRANRRTAIELIYKSNVPILRINDVAYTCQDNRQPVSQQSQIQ